MKYYDFSQCILNPYLYFSFSAKVLFTLRGDKKEYNSTVQTFCNKKDAKQNAAYVALVALESVMYAH